MEDCRVLSADLGEVTELCGYSVQPAPLAYLRLELESCEDAFLEKDLKDVFLDSFNFFESCSRDRCTLFKVIASYI